MHLYHLTLLIPPPPPKPDITQKALSYPGDLSAIKNIPSPQYSGQVCITQLLMPVL